MLSVLFAESGDNFSRLLSFYAPDAERVLDVTYGSGTLTRRAGIRVVGVDRDPMTVPTVRADATQLPFVDASFGVAVYDPPYLYGSQAMHMGPIGGKTWSNARSTWKKPSELIDLTAGVSAELRRVLTPDGVALCKVMDSRFRGKLIRNHDLIADAFEASGFDLIDQIVYIRTVTGSYVNTRSAQSTHGYFLVFRNAAQIRLEVEAMTPKTRKSA